MSGNAGMLASVVEVPGGVAVPARLRGGPRTSGWSLGGVVAFCFLSLLLGRSLRADRREALGMLDHYV